MTSEIEVVVCLGPWAKNWWHAEISPLIRKRRRGCVTQNSTIELLRELGKKARFEVRRDISPNKFLHVMFTEEEITWLKLKYA